MIDTQVLDKLLDIYASYDKVIPEFNINYTIDRDALGIDVKFHKIDFEDYYSQFKENYTVREALNNNLTLVFNSLSEFKNGKENYLRDIKTEVIEKTLNSLDNDIIKKRLEAMLQPWFKLSSQYNIDITEELKIYQEILNNFELINEPKALLEELKYVSHITQQFRAYLIFEQDEDMRSFKQKVLDYINDDTNLFNKYNKKDNKNILNILLKDYPIIENLEIVSQIHQSIIAKINKFLPFNQADVFVREHKYNDSSINNFMLFKSLDNTDEQLDLNVNGHYKKLIIFGKDNSLMIQEKNGKFSAINSTKDKDTIIETIFKDELNEILKNRPYIAKLFIEKLKEDYRDIKIGVIAAQTFLNNESILKSAKFPMIEELKELYFEDLDDGMNKWINRHKEKQYAHSIVSKKYLDLYNDESYELFKQLYESGVTKEKLQDIIGKKIAAYKTSEELNTALSNHLENINEFEIDLIRKKSAIFGASIVVDSGDTLIVRVDNFEQSKGMGTNSWCISRDISYFKSYTEDNAKQYFIYDFTKSSKDNESMIGLTLNENGKHSASHLKNDDSIHMNENLKKFQLAIITSDISNYPKLSDEFKEIKMPKSKLINQI